MDNEQAKEIIDSSISEIKDVIENDETSQDIIDRNIDDIDFSDETPENQERAKFLLSLNPKALVSIILELSDKYNELFEDHLVILQNLNEIQKVLSNPGEMKNVLDGLNYKPEDLYPEIFDIHNKTNVDAITKFYKERVKNEILSYIPVLKNGGLSPDNLKYIFSNIDDIIGDLLETYTKSLNGNIDNLKNHYNDDKSFKDYILNSDDEGNSIMGSVMSKYTTQKDNQDTYNKNNKEFTDINDFFKNIK